MLLTIRDLRKSYGEEPVLQGVTCDVASGETLSVLGRSGSGKTTLLRIIAGLDGADQGQIALAGTDLSGQSAQDRDVVYLYQEPMLFPHLSVRENVAFGLTLRKHRSAPADAASNGAAPADRAVDARVDRMVERLGLSGHGSKRPDQLSGGQKQRVAFGRAAILSPTLLLLDEPFANLDVNIRREMQDLFRRLAADYAITALFVTHNLKEAILMGTRYAHLQNGTLTTYDTTQAFVDDPAVGVREEMSFWLDLHRQTSEPQ